LAAGKTRIWCPRLSSPPVSPRAFGLAAPVIKCQNTAFAKSDDFTGCADQYGFFYWGLKFETISPVFGSGFWQSGIEFWQR